MFAWLFGSDTKAPIFLRIRSSTTFIILTVASSIFTDIFAYGIVVPVFPFALTSRAGIDEKDVQTWLSIFLAVYGASLLVFSPIFGWLGDRMKYRQVPFMIGLLLLGGSTAILCVGNSIAVFAVGRVLQGASAAVVWIVGLALLVDTVGPDEIGHAMGIVGLSMSLAILLAPLLAGVVFAQAGYYAVYAMAFGLIIVDLFLRFTMIEQKNARKWLPAESTLEQNKPSIEEASPRPDTDADALELGNLAKDADHAPSQLPSLQEARTETDPKEDAAPALPLEETTSANTPFQKFIARLPPIVTLFGSRRILSALWASTMQASLMTSFDSILPLFTKNTFGWDSTGAGLIFLPIVASSFLEPLIGKLSDKYGPRWLATSGFVLSCPFLILLRLVDHNSIGQKVMLCAFLAMIGLGLALALTPLMAEFSYAVEAKTKRRPGTFGKNGAYAQSYALFNMAWAAGSMIGPLLAGLTTEASGWPTATLILGCVSIFTAIPAAIWTGGSIFKERKLKKQQAAQQPSADPASDTQ